MWENANSMEIETRNGRITPTLAIEVDHRFGTRSLIAILLEECTHSCRCTKINNDYDGVGLVDRQTRTETSTSSSSSLFCTSFMYNNTTNLWELVEIRKQKK